MAFGGAGMLVSRAMMSAMYSSWGECLERYRDLFGGDEMLTRCAATASGRTKQTVTTEERGLHRASSSSSSLALADPDLEADSSRSPRAEFDIPGDSTGVMQGGIPMLSLHQCVPSLQSRADEGGAD